MATPNQINFNISGDPKEDRPVLIPDNGPGVPHGGDPVPLAADIPGRRVAKWNTEIYGGATVFAGNRSYRLNGADQPGYPTGYFKGMPIDGKPHEGAEFGIPVIEYSPVISIERLTPGGDIFYQAGRPYLWQGATFLRGVARVRDGEDIRAQISQLRRSGVKILRVSGMLTWANFGPTQGDYWNALTRMSDIAAYEGMMLHLTMFDEGTLHWLPDLGGQKDHWNRTIDFARPRQHILLDLMNEVGRCPLDPAQFQRPNFTSSHGSGMTDAPAVTPYWDWAPVHIRRDPPPDARGFAQMDHFNFEATYPKPVPVVPEEHIKPPQYGFNLDYAFKLGQRCGINAGGTFHSDEGVQAVVMPDYVEMCLKAFNDGMKTAWRY